MKLMHLGDLHLGRSIGEFDLIDDQKYILDQILEIVDREKVDAVLIAGDVYDKSVPSEAAVSLLDSFLNALSSRNVSVFMISGNHDSDDRLNYGRWTFERQGVFISAIYNGELDRHDLKVGDSEVCIYMLPFVKASQVRRIYPDEEIETYEDAVRTILDKAPIDENKCNIIVAHQFVAGRGNDPVFGGSEGLGTLNVGTVEKIGYDCFDKFDYVALGHIHSPQKVGRETCRYSGTPLKYSLKEVNDDKSVPLITLNGKDVSIDYVKLKPKREMRHLRGTMKELLDKANVRSPEDFIYATLTDEDVINDAMGKFQAVYPNTVKVDYDNSRTRAVEKVDISQILQQRSFTDLISDFYKQVYGIDISEEEMAVIRDAAREAGVIDEAD
ncbi:MAG: exonuclease SbcCD subunit D [Saccharofermentans sp.]|nr:exonuclease SbcCD subunit D [Saccharofermentans sp.]